MDDERNALKELTFKLEQRRSNIKTKELEVLDILSTVTKLDVVARVVWDFKGNFILCNQLFADLFGLNYKDIVNYSFFSTSPKVATIYIPDIKLSTKVYEENTSNGLGLSNNFYNRYYNKDLNPIWLKWLRGVNIEKYKLGTGQVRLATKEEIEKIKHNYPN